MRSSWPKTRRAWVAVCVVALALVAIGIQIDSGVRAITTVGYWTAIPARTEVLVFTAAAVVIGLFACLRFVAARTLAVVVPGLIFLAVIIATATAGGRALAMVDAVVIMLALWFTGHWLLRLLRLPQLAAQPVVSWLAGVGPLCLLTTFLGRVSLFRWWTVGIVTGALGLAGTYMLVRWAFTRRRDIARAVVDDAVSSATAGWLLLTGAVAAIYTAAPEVQVDPLYAKAWLPVYWARTGHIGAMNSHIQFSITGWFQLVGAWGNLLGSAATGRYLQLLAFMALPIAVWFWARSRGPIAALAAVGLGTVPMFFWQATTADDDMLIAFGVFGLAVATLVVLTPGFLGRDRATGFALGLLAGAGCSMKSFVIPLAIVMLLGYVLSGRGWAAKRERLMFGVIGLVITGGTPIILHWIDTGNPLFPAYNNIFKSPYWLPVNETFNFPFWAGAGVLGFLRAPLEAMFNPIVMGDNVGPGAMGVLALAVVVAVLSGWYWRKRVAGAFVLWVALVIGILFWWDEFRYLRYFLPECVTAIVLLLHVSGPGTFGFQLRPIPRVTSLSLVGLAVGACFGISVASLPEIPHLKVPVKAALGIWKSNAYLTTALPERTALQDFNKISGPHAAMLTNVFERDWLTGDRDLYVSWEVAGLLQLHHLSVATPAAGMRSLRKLGIRWVLSNVPLYINVPPGQRGSNNWVEEMVNRYGNVRAAINGYALYELGGKPRRPAPLSAACDATGVGLPAACWQGTRDSQGTIDTTATRTLQVCPGQLFELQVSQRHGVAPDPISIAFLNGPPTDVAVYGASTPGEVQDLYATVPAGVHQLTAYVNDPESAHVTGARLLAIPARCSG